MCIVVGVEVEVQVCIASLLMTVSDRQEVWGVNKAFLPYQRSQQIEISVAVRPHRALS